MRRDVRITGHAVPDGACGAFEARLAPHICDGTGRSLEAVWRGRGAHLALGHTVDPVVGVLAILILREFG